jgi:hypothetical protein
MDTIKTLLLDAPTGAGASGRTVTVFYAGPHTQNTLEFFELPWNADLVYCVGQTNHVMLTNGRTYGSWAQGFHQEGAFALFGQYPWRGRQRFNVGDRVYLDTTSAAIPAGSFCCMVFQIRDV